MRECEDIPASEQKYVYGKSLLINCRHTQTDQLPHRITTNHPGGLGVSPRSNSPPYRAKQVRMPPRT